MRAINTIQRSQMFIEVNRDVGGAVKWHTVPQIALEVNKFENVEVLPAKHEQSRTPHRSRKGLCRQR